METLNDLYIQLLRVGFLVLRQAIGSRDYEWAEVEIELLHNVPSLIDEPNAERHRYFWFKERQHYIDWVSAPGRTQGKSRMMTYYQPIWREMEPVLLGFLASPLCCETTSAAENK